MFLRQAVRLHEKITAPAIGNVAIDSGAQPGANSVIVRTSSTATPTFSAQPQQSPEILTDLPYDGGTGVAGPATGDTVVGKDTRTRGVVVEVVGGTPETSGNIILRHVHGGTFKDNEELLSTSADSVILVNSASGGTEVDNWASAGAAITTLTTTVVSGVHMPRFRLNVTALTVSNLTVEAST